jgi:hypothetical protein
MRGKGKCFMVSCFPFFSPIGFSGAVKGIKPHFLPRESNMEETKISGQDGLDENVIKGQPDPSVRPNPYVVDTNTQGAEEFPEGSRVVEAISHSRATWTRTRRTALGHIRWH